MVEFLCDDEFEDGITFAFADGSHLSPGARMLLVIVISTWVGMAVTALVLRALLPRQG